MDDSEGKYCVRFKRLANLGQIHLENYFWNEKILNQAPMSLFLVNCHNKTILFFPVGSFSAVYLKLSNRTVIAGSAKTEGSVPKWAKT